MKLIVNNKQRYSVGAAYGACIGLMFCDFQWHLLVIMFFFVGLALWDLCTGGRERNENSNTE